MSVFITILGFILPAVAGGMIGFLASLPKQRRESKERFFYEVYPKRLELYRRTFLTIQDFQAGADCSKNENQKEYALRILSQLGDNFLKLQSEAILFGSGEFNAAIEQTLKHALVFKKEVLADTFKDGETAALYVLFDRLLPYMQKIEETIKRESPAQFIEKHVCQFAKKKSKQSAEKTENDNDNA